MSKIVRATLAVLIGISLIGNMPVEVLAAKSRRSQGLEAFGGIAGGLLFATSPGSTASIATGIRNYAIAHCAPQVLKKWGLNQSWQNIGGAFLSGAVIGGMNSVGSKGLSLNLIKPWTWQPGAVLTDSAKWGAAGAIQHVGYAKNWDKSTFTGATLLASKIGATGVEYGLSKTTGGWQINNDKSSLTWKTKDEFKQIKEKDNPFNLMKNQNSAWKSIAGQGVSLFAQHIADKNGFEMYPEYSRAMGQAVLGEGIVTAALSGFSSAALQHVGNKLGLDPYTAAVTNLGLTSAIRGMTAGGGLELSKEIFLAGAQQAKGNFLSGGIATVDARGNFVYNTTADAAFAANLVDFSRKSRGLSNSSGEKVSGGLMGQVMNEYASNLHSQANANVTGMIKDKFSGVTYERIKTGKYDDKGKEIEEYYRMRTGANGKEYAPLANPNDFGTLDQAKKFNYKPASVEKTAPAPFSLPNHIRPGAGPGNFPLGAAGPGGGLSDGQIDEIANVIGVSPKVVRDEEIKAQNGESNQLTEWQQQTYDAYTCGITPKDLIVGQQIRIKTEKGDKVEGTLISKTSMDGEDEDGAPRILEFGTVKLTVELPNGEQVKSQSYPWTWAIFPARQMPEAKDTVKQPDIVTVVNPPTVLAPSNTMIDSYPTQEELAKAPDIDPELTPAVSSESELIPNTNVQAPYPDAIPYLKPGQEGYFTVLSADGTKKELKMTALKNDFEKTGEDTSIRHLALDYTGADGKVYRVNKDIINEDQGGVYKDRLSFTEGEVLRAELVKQPAEAKRSLTSKLPETAKQPKTTPKVSVEPQEAYEHVIKKEDGTEVTFTEDGREEFIKQYSPSFLKKLWYVPQVLTLNMLPTLMNKNNRIAMELKEPGSVGWLDRDYFTKGTISGYILRYKSSGKEKVEYYKRPITKPAPVEQQPAPVPAQQPSVPQTKPQIPVMPSTPQPAIQPALVLSVTETAESLKAKIKAGEAIISTPEASKKSKFPWKHISSGFDSAIISDEFVAFAEKWGIGSRSLRASAEKEINEGNYGQSCQLLVRKIQERTGLQPDGSIGQNTIKVLDMTKLPSVPSSGLHRKSSTGAGTGTTGKKGKTGAEPPSPPYWTPEIKPPDQFPWLTPVRPDGKTSVGKITSDGETYATITTSSGSTYAMYDNESGAGVRKVARVQDGKIIEPFRFLRYNESTKGWSEVSVVGINKAALSTSDVAEILGHDNPKAKATVENGQMKTAPLINKRQLYYDDPNTQEKEQFGFTTYKKPNSGSCFIESLKKR